MNKHTHSIDDMPPPKWFWIVSSILLVWNLMGVMAFFQQMAVTAEQIAAMPEAEQLLYNSIPIWATIAFAFAVFGGTLGCVGLLEFLGAFLGSMDLLCSFPVALKALLRPLSAL